MVDLLIKFTVYCTMINKKQMILYDIMLLSLHNQVMSFKQVYVKRNNDAIKLGVPSHIFTFFNIQLKPLTHLKLTMFLINVYKIYTFLYMVSRHTLLSFELFILKVDRFASNKHVQCNNSSSDILYFFSRH